MNKEELAARLLFTFIGELEEQVRQMNADLLALEASPADGERIKSLFRVAHTLKGASRAVGVSLIETVCHQLESLLAQARDGKRALGADDFALLFSSADALTEAGQRIKESRDLRGSALEALAARLKNSGNGAPSAPRSPRPAAPSPAATVATVATVPSTPPAAISEVRVEAGKLDSLLAASSQLMVAGDRVAARRQAFEALHELTDQCAAEWSRADHRVRLALERSGAPGVVVQAVNGMRENLRRLMKESGRLIADVAADERMLWQATDEVVLRVRQLRLRPFAEACEALPRVVRDVSAAAGKEVDLDVQGGATEVDRTVLDGLREALTHLARNAIDHGIEDPGKRAAAGKPRRGLLRLTAALQGDRVRVTLADDGAGLDIDAIRHQLVQRGLPVPEDPQELARAVFLGGLSTRSEATAISGRGVGLDIVSAAVQRIRGTVDVRSEPGRGTTFTIECPPSLATVRALLTSIGPQLVAIPISSVERMLRLSPESVRRAEGRDVILTDENPIPLVPLARLLPPLIERPAGGSLNIVILRAGGRKLAVAVDELLNEQEIVLRPVKFGASQLAHIGGAAILGMGKVALVINPASLVAVGLSDRSTGGESIGARSSAGDRRKRLLVVDDSITTRTLEQSILESAGYDVLTAVDGADGWRVIQEQGCDLVVSDVEMPRMDGFALCQAIRASKRFKDLPVVLITALEKAEDRARGMEAGADAYLGKSSFDQNNLLEAVRQLVGAR